uniref:VTT domain-containing protein n=1 Tax=Palpitomonas bilix TaxID=652834 RepID=A0A7S3GC79_9EUKA|mmetsp:Transcript_41169/g.106400  ORF Transcript_41169/g.106400 Transcript_41169/m.106400 type:complete len:283 (+) Transcript_41169:165-1013(+)
MMRERRSPHFGQDEGPTTLPELSGWKEEEKEGRKERSTAFVFAVLAVLFLVGGGVTYLSFRQVYYNTPTEKRQYLAIPHSIDSLKELVAAISHTQEAAPSSVLSAFVSLYILKQGFSIPGSVFLNLLAGALFGRVWGFLLVFIICPFGASLNYMLSHTFAGSLLTRHFPDRLAYLRTKVDENRDNLLYFLLFSRIFPFTPNWFLNFASPLVGIPFPLFFISVMLGLAPYNFLCVQAGNTLSQVTSASDVMNSSVVLQLVGVAAAFLAFGALRARAKKKHDNK